MPSLRPISRESISRARRRAGLLTAALLLAAAAGAVARKPPDPASLPECHDGGPFANMHMKVAIVAGASEGGRWTLSPSTGAVAARFLEIINENSRGITFVPVAAPKADYLIAVAVDESTGDARIDAVNPQVDVAAALKSSSTVVTVVESTGAVKTVTAAALITSPRLDPTLRLTVPPAADTFTSWDDALDSVAGGVLAVFSKGWKTDPPCRRADGTLKLK